MESKNIIFVGTAHPYRGGIASFNERLALELKKEGHKVWIMGFKVQYPSFLFPGKSQYTDTPASKTLDITREVNSVNPFNWIAKGLKLRKLKPDIIFLRYWTPYMSPALGTIARIARTNGHTKIIALTDNVTPHERHFYDDILTRYFIGGIDSFIAMSHEVENDLRRFTQKPIKFSPHPLYDNYGESLSRDEAIEILELDKSKRYALFFGFIRDYKGLDLLLDAWAIYKREESARDKILLVAGEYYNDKNQYIEQIERLGIGDSVKLIDEFIPDNKVREYFCAADTVVQPYKSATQSGVTQIAYHFKVPMVVTNVGGLPEIVPDNKVGYVVSCDAQPLAEAISKSFDQEQQRIFRANIPSWISRFSWSSMAQAFNENEHSC